MSDPRTPIFDAIRAARGKGFDQMEVGAISNLLDALDVPREGGLTVGPAGLALIREFEGCARRLPDGRIQAYPDPGTGGAPWTIGWGSTTDEQGNAIKPGTIWTQERADTRFASHVAEFAEQVAELLGDAPTTQPQFDALASLAYNIGARALGTSTLLKMHKAGSYGAAAEQFSRWNRAGGRVLPGLTRRRSVEADLYRRTV